MYFEIGKAVIYSLIFVLFVVLETQLNKKKRRTKLTEVNHKVLAVSLATSLCYLDLIVLGSGINQDTVSQSLNIWPVVYVVFITSCLFIGSFAQFLAYDNEEYEQDKQDYISKRIHIYKAIIAAPIIEELQFRLLLLQILDPQQQNYYFYNLVQSSLFSMAHVHRAFSSRLPLSQAVMMILPQVGFTFLFGYYAGCILYYTKSIVASIVMHSYCNFLGPPDVAQLMSDDKPNRRRIIMVIHGVGIFAFNYLLEQM